MFFLQNGSYNVIERKWIFGFEGLVMLCVCEAKFMIIETFKHTYSYIHVAQFVFIHSTV